MALFMIFNIIFGCNGDSLPAVAVISYIVADFFSGLWIYYFEDKIFTIEIRM